MYFAETQGYSCLTRRIKNVILLSVAKTETVNNIQHLPVAKRHKTRHDKIYIRPLKKDASKRQGSKQMAGKASCKSTSNMIA